MSNTFILFCKINLISQHFLSGEYFSLLIPQLNESLYAINNKQRPSAVTSLTPPTTPGIPHSSIFAKEITQNNLLFNLNELICTLFSVVPFHYLIYVKFLPDSLDLLFDQLLSPIIYAKVYTHTYPPNCFILIVTAVLTYD
jgi:hypothetical protein